MSYTYQDFLAYFGVGGAHPGGMSFTKELLKHIPITRDSHVLDAGCGTGQTAAFLQKDFGCSVTAIDQHPIMIEKACQRFKEGNLNIEIREENIEGTSLPSNTFDIIIAESVTIFTNIQKVVKEYARLLKDDGIVLAHEMTAKQVLSQQEMDVLQDIYAISRVPTKEEWIQLFKDAGFLNVESIMAKNINDTPEFMLSNTIDPALYDIWDQHQLVTEKYADRLQYYVYRVQKS
ncbi:class I SAM-dependent methyltransferase [Oceanobacillus halotolerans]|uniref:class I SAM-dependent methyltransferase n=1 Tax=Oceanobacillus halotolerans TaxID=2663380 RepID=UPI0013DCC795|nr:class I SAM-dependent methyltransferase [Oceanobacillus halotolerans]